MIGRGRLCFAIVALIATLVSFPATARKPPLSGISYNPSGMADFATQEAGSTAARIRDDLETLAPLTRNVRIYSVARGFDHTPAVAHPLGLKITLGLWLGKNPDENAAEIARGIATVRANPHAIARIVVGNEVLQHEFLKPKDLIAAMVAVRRGIAGLKIPVGTAEIWPVWQDARTVVKASDFIGVHILPYWDGVGVDDAAAYVARRYDELQQAYPGKPVIILETGWPSAGPVHQGAVPSPENQARFARDFTALARARHFTYFLFEAYDQPWKTREGDTALWGLFDLDRKPKPVAIQLLSR